jgi:KaiC/GvpD/RAD55 family RecA-like ATPase
MERASESFERGDDKAALETMDKMLRSKVARPGISVKPMFPKRFRVVKPLPRVPTGLWRLDNVIGGAQRKEVNYIIGATGVGKSAVCTTFAHSAIKSGHRVLYIDTENGEKVVQSRFYSRMTYIPYDLIEQDMLGPESLEFLQVWLDRNSERLADRFRFAELGSGVATMAQVEAVIMEQKELGFIPDVVLFDSPDHLMMDGEAQRWEKFAEVANQLKGVTERTDVAMWATSQAGGENIESKIATTAHGADTKQKVRNAAIVLSINHRIDPKTLRPVADANARDLYIAKNRNGPGKYLIPLLCDLSRMRMSAPPDVGAHHA